MKKYTYVGLGGTFDHFHAGHEAFLLAVAEQAEHLIIGVTKPELTTGKVRPDLLDRYDVRYQAVANFCQSHQLAAEIVPLTDIYGPTITDQRIEAVFVTQDTEKGAQQINQERERLGMSPLPIEKVPLLLDDVGKTIASQRIRTGLISRQGSVYTQLFSRPISLTEQQRHFFGQLHGKLVTEPSHVDQSITRVIVGDSSYEAFEFHRWPYTLAIIDFIKQRQPYTPQLELLNKVQLTVENLPGTITPQLATTIQSALDRSLRILKVDGEEDLAAVVAVLLLPLESYVYYGQPGAGLVEVYITEALKQQFYQVLRTK